MDSTQWSTITLVLQVNQLTKCASHPKLINLINFGKKALLQETWIRYLLEIELRNFL